MPATCGTALDDETLRTGIGTDSPIRVWRARPAQFNGIGTHLAQTPAIAAGVGLVELMAPAGFATLRAINQQLANGAAFKGELLNGPDAGL